ncbi:MULTISPECIES: 5'-methylthioadenosine/adenosylhomocysteine nucleosidase [unclassified Meiothermus]|uniref:5'-methylthioadenosine/adenosylhomocysteine nucleosidase n=1 Tax=unclassified Meiothermus TaxID=370471 RepID=UPI0013EB6B41|nr:MULTISPECIES: 5'-methylthioadenosine/adenosylhomocysteine nucleosidase [unclassified Meiothermus]
MVALFAAEGTEARALWETLGLEQAMKGPKPTHRGIFADHEVVLIEAGVGKVAAASAVAYAQARFEPRMAIWAGVAGALNPKLQALDVLVAHDAVQWDVDITAFGRKPGELASGERFVRADAELSTELYRAALALHLPVHWGRVASGDRFLADPNEAQRLREVFAADAVEMEGAAALWTAGRLGVPMALLRTISDGAGDEATVNFQEFLEAASRRLGEVLAHFLHGGVSGGGAGQV